MRDQPSAWFGWRRRVLVLAALLACLCVFALAHQVAVQPQIDARWSVAEDGRLVLESSPLPALSPYSGKALLGLRGLGLGQPEVAVDALALHHAARWQVSDTGRQRQATEQQALADALAGGPVQLRFEDGALLQVQASARGYGGLGLLFWPLTGCSLFLVLYGVVLLLARPQLGSLLFLAMALCQAANLELAALETVPGLGSSLGGLAGQLGLRVALDLCIAAAALQAWVLHPHRLPRARLWAALGWLLLPAWLALAHTAGSDGLSAWGSLWWWGQSACLLLGTAAWAAIHRSYSLEPNPYALVIRRFTAAALIGFVLVTLAVAGTAAVPDQGADFALAASVGWTMFFAAMLMLTPTLGRSRQVLREFALLAGISTVATALDLLFLAVFSLGSYTSLTIAVFLAMALYAGARQWMLSHLLGSSMLTTERTFDQLYRAAREVQAWPARHPQVLAALLHELFEPLEVQRVERVPRRARVVGGGAALVVPLPSNEDEAAPAGALALRFASRGRRLFTLDDARLADRVIDQLRRAVAYDQAVERGRFEERQRIAQDLHDDIGARLLTLMYQAPSRELEDYIRHTLQDLKTLTRGLAATEHRLSHAAAEWKSDLTQRLSAAHASLGWSFDVDQDLKLSVVQWSALTRVLRELVSNALYHGHAAHIDVHVALEGTQLTLQVTDDGEGRTPQAWAHGLGLGGVRKRVKLLGGKVAWRENAPRGIVCAVRVSDFSGRP